MVGGHRLNGGGSKNIVDFNFVNDHMGLVHGRGIARPAGHDGLQ